MTITNQRPLSKGKDAVGRAADEGAGSGGGQQELR